MEIRRAVQNPGSANGSAVSSLLFDGSLDAQLGGEALVSGLLELVGELGPTARDDAPVHEHVHPVGAQLGEHARVVRDREHTEATFGRHGLDAPGDVAQRVDVEAAVDLVEYREPRLEYRQLQRLGALLLATGELDVHAALEELVRDAEAVGLELDLRTQLTVGIAALTKERSGEEVDEAYAGKLHRVLQREEQTTCRAFVGGQPEELFAVDGDRAGRDVVVVPAHEDVRQGRLARTVRAHQRVHLARAHLEVDAPQDLVAVNRRVEIHDPQHAHGRVTITSSPSTRTL